MREATVFLSCTYEMHKICFFKVIKTLNVKIMLNLKLKKDANCSKLLGPCSVFVPVFRTLNNLITFHILKDLAAYDCSYMPSKARPKGSLTHQMENTGILES